MNYVKKLKRLQVCPETSKSCSYWQNWFAEKGLKCEVADGMLWRLMDDSEREAYRQSIQPIAGAA